MKRMQFNNSSFLLQQTTTDKANSCCVKKTSRVPQSKEWNSLLCKLFLHSAVQLKRPETPGNKTKSIIHTNCTITCLYSSHTRAVPPEGSSPAPPAGRRRCCPPALSGSPCGSRQLSAPPVRPRSLMRKQYKQRSTAGLQTHMLDRNEPERSPEEESKQIYNL